MKTHLLNVLIFIALLLATGLGAFAQVSINTDNSLPDPSAGLDVKFNNKGVLLPRMTYEQRNTIVNPAEGLMIMCTNCTPDGKSTLSIFKDGKWEILMSGCYHPNTPTAGTHVPDVTQIIWKWNKVPITTGYKWNTINDYFSALDVGTDTSYTETGLNCVSPYTRYVWAHNGCGYSSPATLMQSTLDCLICGNPITDSRDGKTYNTVLIGTQCWFAQNLNVGTRINGSVEQTDNSVIEKYCYGDNDANCDVYGGLYQWNELMQYLITEGVQGICPTGWHLPSDAEWTTLTTFLGGESVAGGKMKEAGYVHWASPNTGATNSSGFTALPGASRSNTGNFASLTAFAYIWSSSQNDATNAWYRSLGYNHGGVNRYSYYKTYGFSARCIQN